MTASHNTSTHLTSPTALHHDEATAKQPYRRNTDTMDLPAPSSAPPATPKSSHTLTTAIGRLSNAVYMSLSRSNFVPTPSVFRINWNSESSNITPRSQIEIEATASPLTNAARDSKLGAQHSTRSHQHRQQSGHNQYATDKSGVVHLIVGSSSDDSSTSAMPLYRHSQLPSSLIATQKPDAITRRYRPVELDVERKRLPSSIYSTPWQPPKVQTEVQRSYRSDDTDHYRFDKRTARADRSNIHQTAASNLHLSIYSPSPELQLSQPTPPPTPPAHSQHAAHSAQRLPLQPRQVYSQRKKPSTPVRVDLSWRNVSVTVPKPQSSPARDTLYRVLGQLGLPTPMPMNSNETAVHLRIERQTPQTTVQTLLQPISGVARAGRILAIMGASGSSKTTLLNLLSGRGINNDTATITGHYSLNSRSVTAAELASHCAFVQQDDVLLATATVRETLEFSALIGQQQRPTPPEQHAIAYLVEQNLAELELTHCAERQIGGAMNGGGGGGEAIGSLKGGSGLSGGQVRRVSIGVELVNDPAIICLDEFSSGLDATTAYAVMELLRRLADRGKTIICTIHSPSARMFMLFDDLLLLAQGHVVYSGPVDRLCEYFADLGHSVPPNTNPAEHVVELVRIVKPRDVARVRYLIAWQQKHQPAVLLPEHQPHNQLANLSSRVHDEQHWSHDRFLWQVRLLTSRGFTDLNRQRPILYIRLLQHLALSFFVGLLYFHATNDQSGVYARIGFLFFMICILALLTVTTSVLAFTEQRTLFVREHVSHKYSTLAYFVSKCIVELPVQTVLAVAFSFPGYYLTGLRVANTNVIQFVLAMVLFSHTAHSVAMILGAVSSSSFVGSILAPLSVSPFMLFCGFFMNIETLPQYIDWLRYFSPHLYVFRAIVVNEFTGLTFKCNSQQVVHANVYNTTYSLCPIVTGNDMLSLVSFEGTEASYGFNIGLCVVLLVVYRVLAALALHLVVQRSKSRATSQAADRPIELVKQYVDKLFRRANR